LIAEFVIEIQPEVPLAEGVVELLVTAVTTTLYQQKISPPAELTLLLTDDKKLRQLNRDFRQVDTATDVLSFPDGTTSPDTAIPYLGDIAISVPYATRQAAQTGHDLVAELQLLAIHGTLHLLGHNHANHEEKAAMWATQQTILDRLGLSHVTPVES
jgi:probable rRNA maturation factor